MSIVATVFVAAIVVWGLFEAALYVFNRIADHAFGDGYHRGQTDAAKATIEAYEQGRADERAVIQERAA